MHPDGSVEVLARRETGLSWEARGVNEVRFLIFMAAVVFSRLGEIVLRIGDRDAPEEKAFL